MKIKKKNKRKFTIAELIIIGIVLSIALVFIILEISAPDMEISVWLKENVLDTSEIGKGFMTKLPAFVKNTIYVVVIYEIGRAHV